MCGIVGVVGTINKPAVDAFKFMLLVDQIRGKHSTGMLLADGKEHITIKKAVNSSDFLDLGVVTKALTSATDNNAIIGHNRYATVGAVNSTNAHPFTHGSITGVHNGTLRNKWNLPDAKDFIVDSDNLYHAISKQGIKETIKGVDGAFALAWHDNSDSTFNLLRNDERPMHYALSKDGKVFLYASEAWMIVVAANKSKIEIGNTINLAVGTLLSINLKGYVKNRDLVGPRVTTKKLNFLEKAQTGGTGGGRNNSYNYNRKKVKVMFDFSRSARSNATELTGVSECGSVVRCTSYQAGLAPKLDTWYEGEVQSTTYNKGAATIQVFAYSLKPCKDPFEEKVVSLEDKRKDKATTAEDNEPLVWFGDIVTRLEFNHLVNKGCAWCTETLLDDSEVIPISKQEFVCADCHDIPEVNKYVKGNL